MYFFLLLVISVKLVTARGSQGMENFKDQFCTDPRTMKKHAAYTEWADAYSCTRHRCQPGGRNLAIYTVGCKRVEAPESAIECEEVVEDTNMQFPYCCTRLRCLVVVRGEVWTRVLGQPWETLPAAPWSHMYKMKKPPPADSSFSQKNTEGPIYELAQEATPDESNRRSKKFEESLSEIRPRTADRSGSPDIVIALSTGNEKEGKSNDKEHIKQKTRRKYNKKSPAYPAEAEHSGADDDMRRNEIADEITEKELEQSEELIRPNTKHKRKSWVPEINTSQWPENEVMVETENAAKETMDTVPDFHLNDGKIKPNNLQDLVDAIGTRMRDIENVVQKMSEKVRKPENDNEFSSEKRYPKIHASKYLHNNQEVATEKSPQLDDAVSANGYYSDVSNTIRRAANPKAPPVIYMAPVETRRAGSLNEVSDLDDIEKKRKKRHKKKKNKNGHHKKHHANLDREEKRAKGFNKINSLEMQLASVEDSSLVI